MSARVRDLLPGDLVRQGGQEGTFISSSPHPVHRGLRLVIWYLAPGPLTARAAWSLDALSEAQEVGDQVPSSAAERWERVQAAFRSSQ